MVGQGKKNPHQLFGSGTHSHHFLSVINMSRPPDWSVRVHINPYTWQARNRLEARPTLSRRHWTRGLQKDVFRFSSRHQAVIRDKPATPVLGSLTSIIYTNEQAKWKLQASKEEQLSRIWFFFFLKLKKCRFHKLQSDLRRKLPAPMHWRQLWLSLFQCSFSFSPGRAPAWPSVSNLFFSDFYLFLIN